MKNDSQSVLCFQRATTNKFYRIASRGKFKSISCSHWRCCRPYNLNISFLGFSHSLSLALIAIDVRKTSKVLPLLLKIALWFLFNAFLAISFYWLLLNEIFPLLTKEEVLSAFFLLSWKVTAKIAAKSFFYEVNDKHRLDTSQCCFDIPYRGICRVVFWGLGWGKIVFKLKIFYILCWLRNSIVQAESRAISSLKRHQETEKFLSSNAVALRVDLHGFESWWKFFLFHVPPFDVKLFIKKVLKSRRGRRAEQYELCLKWFLKLASKIVKKFFSELADVAPVDDDFALLKLLSREINKQSEKCERFPSSSCFHWLEGVKVQADERQERSIQP